MTEILRAIQYRNIDEACKVMDKAGVAGEAVFDDAGEEPSGLLTVIADDQVGEDDFARLVGAGVGVLVEVERFPFSGYGPPAQEPDYMGFASRRVCYALKGRRLPIEIKNCPSGARDLHHLEAMVLDREHPLDREALASALDLPEAWSFEDLFDLIAEGVTNAQEIDGLIHRGPEESPN